MTNSMRTLIIGAGALEGPSRRRPRRACPVRGARRRRGCTAEGDRAPDLRGRRPGRRAGRPRRAPGRVPRRARLRPGGPRHQGPGGDGDRSPGGGLAHAGGTLLPIQNGAVSRLLADRLGNDRVLGGLSNLGATLHAPGRIEQRNAGHLLVGELAGGVSERAERVRAWLGRGVEVRVTGNLAGAIWSKLLLNCSVTTLGAIAGRTMREYVGTPIGRAVFDWAYDEALSVALASGARPERMMVDPVPPGWAGRAVPGAEHEAWLGRILDAYGDLKPSMLQDFERGRVTRDRFHQRLRRRSRPSPPRAHAGERGHRGDGPRHRGATSCSLAGAAGVAGVRRPTPPHVHTSPAMISPCSR